MWPPERGLRVSWSFFLLVLLALAVSPACIVFSVLFAAALHECGHLLALRAFHVPVEGLRLTALGASLYANGLSRLSYGRELLVTLAGPAANLLCGFLLALAAQRLASAEGFVLAGAQLLLGAFNLLPIPPLDGSRALYLAVAFFLGPHRGDAAAALAGLSVSLALLLAALRLFARTGGGVLFLFAAAALFLGALRQLRLAKIGIRV